jgi:hypothetical protein
MMARLLARLLVPLAFLQAAPVRAEEPPGPDYTEDFENPPLGGGIYDGWDRLISPLYPPYNRITLERDSRRAHSGERFLSLVTQGGFTAFQMNPRGAWKIEPGRTYRLTVYARLTGTRRNAATASLVWLDRRFRPLRVDASSPLVGEAEWRPLGVEAAEAPEGALWVAVRLEFGGEDVRGECSFDSVRLNSPPGLAITPLDRRLPLFETPAKPRFRVVPTQLPLSRYWLETAVTGVSGAERAPRRRWPVLPGSELEVELPLEEPGAFTLQATLLGPTGPVLGASIPFLIVGPAWMPSEEPGHLFGGLFDPGAQTYLDPAKLVQLTALRSAQVVLWREPDLADRRPLSPGRLLEFVRELGSADHLEVSGVLAQVPADLFARLDEDTRAQGLAALLHLGRKHWEPELRATVSRYREFIPFWQIGQSAGCARLATEDLLKASDFPANYVWTTIRANSESELLKKLIAHAASGSKEPTFVPMDSLMLDPQGRPGAALLALRAANETLSGATPRADLPARLGEPVRFAFEKGGMALLALWSDDAEVEQEVHWGEQAEVFEPLGGIRRIRDGERLRVGGFPLFVGNVEIGFLESLTSLELVDPAEPGKPISSLPLRTDPQVRLLRFRNLSPDQEITNLRFRFAGELPANWIVRPVAASVPPLGPQKEMAQELSFTLPPTQEEAKVALSVELTFQQGGRDRMIRRSLPLDLVAQIGIEVDVTPDAGGRDARRIRVNVSNRTSRPIHLIASIRIPNQPERTELLGPIAPGFPADRGLEYRVGDVSLLDPSRRRIEILCDERGGERLHARKVIPLK